MGGFNRFIFIIIEIVFIYYNFLIRLDTYLLASLRSSLIAVFKENERINTLWLYVSQGI